MKLTCPNCLSYFDMAQAVEDDSGRQLMVLLGRQGELSRDLVPYLRLFKPRTQALRWSRALALATDIEAMRQQYHPADLAHGMRQTVDAMMSKGSFTPLNSHNYLKKILKDLGNKGRSTTSQPSPAHSPVQLPPQPESADWMPENPVSPEEAAANLKRLQSMTKGAIKDV